jgi:N-dimethylarginine dimethylaminohydrolase
MVEDPSAWHYASRPDLTVARREHDAVVEVLRQTGAEVLFHDAELPTLADSMFVHDPVLITDGGAIQLRMGKELRRGEEAALIACLEQAGVPLLARLEGDAMAESGDLVWLDQKTLAVGQGFRTNAAGFEQLKQALAPLSVRCLPVPLPVYCGADACLHLMSVISIVDERKAVVYLPLLPVPFYRELLDRGFELIEVPEQEFATQGPNVLALAPGHLLMIAGNDVTAERLRAAGCTVATYPGDEVSLKTEGGPTCLTRPVLRRC